MFVKHHVDVCDVTARILRDQFTVDQVLCCNQYFAFAEQKLSLVALKQHPVLGRVGVWVERPDKPKTLSGAVAEDKIAAIGIRLRKWISFHGISINVEPDLNHFDGIVPCGITEHGVTSLVDLSLPVAMEDIDVALKRSFNMVFAGP